MYLLLSLTADKGLDFVGSFFVHVRLTLPFLILKAFTSSFSTDARIMRCYVI
ncbi:hypothetical protein ACUW6F_001460 [Staphylococcus saprophyticus]